MIWKDREQSSNVDDRRYANTGSSGSGGSMPSLGTMMFLFPIIKKLLGTKLGMGIVAIGAVAYFMGFNPFSSSSSSQSLSKPSAQEDEQARFISTVLRDVEIVWGDIFKAHGSVYKEPKMVLYRGNTTGGCGEAKSDMGPFYCPADESVYIDLGFFDELQKKHNAGGDFAVAYVLAHEVGHHVQNRDGTLRKVHNAQGKVGEKDGNALQVKVELQADCYAGLWASHAQKRFNILEAGDIDEALNTASAIGDDTLQKEAQGYTVPDSFTHGSSAERSSWFKKGFEGGTLESCDTFR